MHPVSNSRVHGGGREMLSFLPAVPADSLHAGSPAQQWLETCPLGLNGACGVLLWVGIGKRVVTQWCDWKGKLLDGEVTQSKECNNGLWPNAVCLQCHLPFPRSRR